MSEGDRKSLGCFKFTLQRNFMSERLKRKAYRHFYICCYKCMALIFEMVDSSKTKNALKEVYLLELWSFQTRKKFRAHILAISITIQITTHQTDQSIESSILLFKANLCLQSNEAFSENINLMGRCCRDVYSVAILNCSCNF
jgi:hypothetical protein